MALMISFIATLMLFCAFIFLLSHEHEIKVKKRIESFVGSTQVNDKAGDERNKEILKKNIGHLRDRGKDYFSKNLSSQKEEKLEKVLLQLGNPWRISCAELQLYIILFQICFPIGLAILGILAKFKLILIIILFLFGVILSLLLPNVYFNSKIRNRQDKALRELPDFLDLLTVSLEAGLGFDLALSKVIAKSNGVLSSEFHTCLEEIRLGKTRREALTGVKERLNFDSLNSLINGILQAEKLGMSMVQIFRIKSQEEREKRRQRAEEAAMKAPIKMLFPLVIFIFPSIFIVILGPAVLQIVTSLGKK